MLVLLVSMKVDVGLVGIVERVDYGLKVVFFVGLSG